MRTYYDNVLLRIDGISDKEVEKFANELQGITRGIARFFKLFNLEKTCVILVTNDREKYNEFLNFNSITNNNQDSYDGDIKGFNVLCMYRDYAGNKEFKTNKDNYLSDIKYFYANKCFEQLTSGKKYFDWVKRGIAICISERPFENKIDCLLEDLKNDNNISDDTAATVVSKVFFKNMLLSTDIAILDKDFLFKRIERVNVFE